MFPLQSILAMTLKAKILGILLDNDLTLLPHRTSICKAANFHLYRLAHISKYLNPKALKKVVQCLISLKMDYHKILLVGFPKLDINRLQHMMNCAA